MAIKFTDPTRQAQYDEQKKKKSKGVTKLSDVADTGSRDQSVRLVENLRKEGLSDDQIRASESFKLLGQPEVKEKVTIKSSPLGVEEDVTERRSPTVATPTSPVKEKGVPKISVVDAADDTDRMIEIGLKKAKGEELSDDDIRFLLKKQFAPATTESIYGENPYKDIISGAETNLSEEERRRRDITQQRVDEEQKRIDRNLERDISRTEQAADKQAQAVQRALSFSGFGRSTYNAEKQSEIYDDMSEKERILQDAANREAELYKATLEGADDSYLQGLQSDITSLKQNAANYEVNAAMKVAELNAQNNVDPLTAIENIVQLLGEKTSTGQPINKNASELLGYISDEFGNPVLTDEQGFPVPIAKEAKDSTKVQYVQPQIDDFGNIVTPAGYFDFDTRTFTPLSMWSGGGGEFFQQGTTPSQVGAQNSRVATYSQIFKGSSLNEYGVDLAGAKGSPITSNIMGKVISAEKVDGWGNQVKIVDKDGNIHQFSHLESVNVAPGQVVTSGGMIGTMGNTGNVLKSDGTKPSPEELASGRGTHLDYTVYKPDGKPYSVEDAMAWAGISGNYKVGSYADAIQKGYEGASGYQEYLQQLRQGNVPVDLRALEKDEKKPLSGEASKIRAISQTGINNIKDLREAINALPEGKSEAYLQYQTDPVISALVDQLADKIGRLRSGGAINKEEEARFKRNFSITTRDLLFADNLSEILLQKLKLAEDEFLSVAGGVTGQEMDVNSLSELTGYSNAEIQEALDKGYTFEDILNTR